MIHFMLSMYLSSWWWVHGCMDELQRITTGVMGLMVCDIFYLKAYNSNEELKYVTGSEKTAHFAHIMIFQYKCF